MSNELITNSEVIVHQIANHENQYSISFYKKKDIAKIIAINLNLKFASGCLGGFLNSITVWLFSFAGITRLFNVQIAPDLTASWLYPRIV